METRYCPSCHEVRAVVQPPCADGHLDCPEWACIECGAAIIGGWISDDVMPAPRGRTSAA